MARTHHRRRDPLPVRSRFAEIVPATSDEQSTSVEAAVQYATRMGWAVLPGCTQRGRGGPCGHPDCLNTSPHPATRYTGLTASRDEKVIRRWWRKSPSAPILLPAGQRFDVLDVPRYAGPEGLHRLELMGYQLGPIAETGEGRILIWVRADARLLTPEIDYGRWPHAVLDLHCHSTGDYILAPPTGNTHWLEPPKPYTEPTLPHAADLLGTITHTCRQLRGQAERG